MVLRVLFRLLVAVPVVLLGACGNNAPATKTSVAKSDKIVYASLDDCVDSAKLEAAVCDQVFEAAIRQHEKSAKRYRSLEACEKEESAGRCERTAANEFMPRPVAFLVTLGAKASAQVMYAGQKGALVFRTASGTTIGPDGDVPLSDRAKDRLTDLKPQRRRG